MAVLIVVRTGQWRLQRSLKQEREQIKFTEKIYNSID